MFSLRQESEGVRGIFGNVINFVEDAIFGVNMSALCHAMFFLFKDLSNRRHGKNEESPHAKLQQRKSPGVLKVKRLGGITAEPWAFFVVMLQPQCTPTQEIAGLIKGLLTIIVPQ